MNLTHQSHFMASQDSQPFHWHYTELEDKNFQIHGRSLLLILILFSFLLFFTLLVLYARWVCRYRRLSTATNTTPPSITATPHQVAAPTPSRSLGLDPSIINSLPIVLHRPSTTTTTSDEAQCCSICLSTFQDEEKVKVLPACHHAYHPQCVDKWLGTQSSCPLCRASLRVDSESAVP